jgi:hypothetical protein
MTTKYYDRANGISASPTWPRSILQLRERGGFGRAHLWELKPRPKVKQKNYPIT